MAIVGTEVPAELTNESSVPRRDCERGSISILTLCLFLIVLTTIFLATNVATVVVARRSLISATESAAIRASHVLDESAYYKDGASRGVPIDCRSAQHIAEEEISTWSQSTSAARRPELVNVEVVEFSCFNEKLELAVRATALLPFLLPHSSVSRIQINSRVGVSSWPKG